MAKTVADIANQAVAELLIVGEGQSASPEDVAEAIAKFGPMLASMRYRDIWKSSDDNNFSEEYFLPLSYLLAEECAPTLAGRPRDAARVMELENDLLVMQNRPLERNELYVDRGLRQGRRWGWADWRNG